MGATLSPKEIRKKNESLGDLKSSCLECFLGGLTVFLVKRLCKIKYGAEGSISNADLGLFYPNNVVLVILKGLQKIMHLFLIYLPSCSVILFFQFIIYNSFQLITPFIFSSKK